MLDLGKIMITPEGDWSGRKNYEFLSLVFYNGGGYVAKKDNVGVQPDTDPDTWMFIGDGSAEVVEHLHTELFSTSLDGYPALYLKAPEGAINTETDTLVFARCVSTSRRIPSDSGVGYDHERRKGWIRPRKHNSITLRYSKSYTKNGWDYFAIVPSISKLSDLYANYRVQDYNRWDTLANDMEENAANLQEHVDRGDKDYRGMNPAKLNKKCGICVERNGKPITDYMPFRLLANGKTTVGHAGYVEGWGPIWGFKIG